MTEREILTEKERESSRTKEKGETLSKLPLTELRLSAQ